MHLFVAHAEFDVFLGAAYGDVKGIVVAPRDRALRKRLECGDGGETARALRLGASGRRRSGHRPVYMLILELVFVASFLDDEGLCLGVSRDEIGLGLKPRARRGARRRRRRQAVRDLIEDHAELGESGIDVTHFDGKRAREDGRTEGASVRRVRKGGLGWCVVS